MWDYLFFDNENGEQFFVECDSFAGAWEIIHREWDGEIDGIEYLGRYSPAEAEIIGYDTF